MALPQVTFNIAENGLDLAGDGVQKIPGLVVSGASVVGKVQVGDVNRIFSVEEAEALGITDADNPLAYQHVKDFYKEAGRGAELNIMLVSSATSYEDMADPLENHAKKLLNESGGRIRILGLVKEEEATPTITSGIDEDSKLGATKLQALADEFAEKYMPFRAVISGNNFNGAVGDLEDFTESDLPNVAMSIANTDGSGIAAIGLLVGRAATIPTQRSIARVKDGAVELLEAYLTDGSSVESYTDSWDAIHNKAYIFMRSFPGRAGYYFTDDPTMTADTNDFSSLARGLVIDEALIIANNTLTAELNDEVPMTDDGKIQPVVIKSFQGQLESDIDQLMTANEKISSVKAFIDADQNVLQTDKIVINLSIVPVGYAKTIEVNLGFTTNIT